MHTGWIAHVIGSKVEILPTSIEEGYGNQAPDLSINPNPFTDELQIASRSGIIRSTELQIYDIHGRLVLSQPRAPVPVHIHLSKLAPGMYLVHTKESDGTLYTFKVMKV